MTPVGPRKTIPPLDKWGPPAKQSPTKLNCISKPASSHVRHLIIHTDPDTFTQTLTIPPKQNDPLYRGDIPYNHAIVTNHPAPRPHSKPNHFSSCTQTPSPITPHPSCTSTTCLCTDCPARTLLQIKILEESLQTAKEALSKGPPYNTVPLSDRDYQEIFTPL